MADHDGPTVADLFREAPTRTLICTVLPVAIAVAQLLNGFYTGLPLWVAVGFAAAVLASTASLVRHHRAELRLERLESELRT